MIGILLINVYLVVHYYYSLYQLFQNGYRYGDEQLILT